MTQLNWQPGMTLEVIEKESILQAFRFYRGNKTATANALGIAIRTLDNKLERYQLDGKSIDTEREQRTVAATEWDRKRRGLDAEGNSVIGRPVDTSKPIPRATTETSGKTTDGDAAEAGIRVEPTIETPTEHAVPMPIGKEVQAMSQRSAAANHSRKAGR